MAVTLLAAARRSPLLRSLAQAALLVLALSLFAFAFHCDQAWFERHIFLPQQFFLVADARIASAARIAAAMVGLVLLAFLPFVPHGSRLRRLVIAALCAVPATEVVLQWKARRLLRSDLVAAMDALTSVDPRYGVTLKPSMDRTQVMSGRPVRFVTDAERRRISDSRGGIDARRASLVFAGESTVAGHGLAWDETFPALVGARLGFQVVNVASMNYRVDQSWQRLADELPRLERPLATVGFFLPGLLGREFAGGPHPVARARGTSRDTGFDIVPPEPPSFWQRSGFYRIFRHVYWSDQELAEGMASLSAVLRAMDRVSRQRGIPCIFVVTGHTPPWMLDELFVKNGLDDVVVEIPPEELLADGHPNQKGSRRIADALAARLQRTLR